MMLILLFVVMIGIILFSIVVPLIVYVASAKKRIIVFYDFSDAILSSIVYLISSVGVLAVYRGGVLDFATFLGKYDLVDSLDKGYTLSASILVTSLSLVMLIYSFLVAYYYNRPRKKDILLAFIGRYFLTSGALSLPVLVWMVSVAIFGYFHLSDWLIIATEGVAIALVILTIARFSVYKPSFSDMSHFIDFKYMDKLGIEFGEKLNAEHEKRIMERNARRINVQNRIP